MTTTLQYFHASIFRRFSILSHPISRSHIFRRGEIDDKGTHREGKAFFERASRNRFGLYLHDGDNVRIPSHIRERLGIFANRDFWFLIGLYSLMVLIWFLLGFAIGISNAIVRGITCWLIFLGCILIFTYIFLKKFGVPNKRGIDHALEEHG